jgi:crossover junction endodeoxyribonuclease RuvC
MLVVGIDPGLRGGVAGLDLERRILWATETPVVKEKDKLEYDIARIAALLRAAKPDLVVLERVHSMPRQGVASTFLFGMGFGILRGIIGTLDLPIRLVAPQTWKAKLQITADKETSRNRASELFADCRHFWKLKKHDGIAEAALLAHFGADLPALDLVVPGDISELYQIKDNKNVRKALHDSRRHHDIPSSTRSGRARNSPRRRVDLRTGRSCAK